jgi:ABC-type antimicrobial peptide transport system permease subunit
MALGADRMEIVRLVVARGLSLALAGSAIGVIAGLALSRLLESRLHGIASRDPWSFAFAAAVGLAIGIAAVLVPAFRASRLDPMIAVRTE